MVSPFMNRSRGATLYGLSFAALLDFYSRTDPGDGIADDLATTWPMFSLFGTCSYLAVECTLILLDVFPRFVLEVYEVVPAFVRYGWSFVPIFLVNYYVLIRNGFGLQSVGYFRRQVKKPNGGYLRAALLAYFPLILVISAVLVYQTA